MLPLACHKKRLEQWMRERLLVKRVKVLLGTADLFGVFEGHQAKLGKPLHVVADIREVIGKSFACCGGAKWFAVETDGEPKELPPDSVAECIHVELCKVTVISD
jgi:hypothetical protein